jgi:hypothetical protein
VSRLAKARKRVPRVQKCLLRNRFFTEEILGLGNRRLAVTFRNKIYMQLLLVVTNLLSEVN